MAQHDQLDRLLWDNAKVICELERDEERLRPLCEEWTSFRPDPRDYASACECLRLGKAGMERAGIQARLVKAYRTRYDLVKRRHPALFPRSFRDTMPSGTILICLCVVVSLLLFWQASTAALTEPVKLFAAVITAVAFVFYAS